MKKLLISTVAVASLFATPSIEDLQKQIKDLQTQLQEVKQSTQDTADSLQQVKAAHYEDHINFHFGIRTSADYLYYKMKNGDKYTNNVLSNRVRLTGLAKVSDNLKATLMIEANNMFGMNTPANYDNSNWTANETPDDSNIRVKEAFFNYFFGEDGNYMFSAGRRPSVGGYPANLREGDVPTSPIAHLVNLEFDGFSLWLRSGVFGSYGDDYGTNLKFCFGRGISSSQGKFNATAPYIKSKNPSNDMGGFVFVPYNDMQYSVWWENIWAWHVEGYDKTNNMTDLGNYFGSNLIFKADGIGDGISDFLDDTKAFVSFAFTQTNPDNNKQMLGSSDSKIGYSVWIGADMPVGDSDDRMGINVVSGSKYYRAMTYGEDTLAGSIAAVRGLAIDAYYNKKLVDHLTTSFRITSLNYNNSGSEAFFGVAGDPNQSNYVENALDARVYIRYQF